MNEKKDINEVHREFWEKRKERTDELISDGPTARLAYAEYLMHAEDEPFKDQKPYDLMVDKAHKTITLHSDALRSVVNAINARAPRPKKKPTHKTVVVDAMRFARREDRSLDDFIIGAIKGGYPGIELERLTSQGEVYQIYCDAMVPTGLDEDDDQAMADARSAAIVKRTHKALETWWAEAAKPEKS
jgi:hypothetical protein